MKEEPTPPTISTARRPEPDQPREAQRGPRTAAALKPLVPGMRRLLFTAAVLVLLAGFQLFVFTGRTATFFAVLTLATTLMHLGQFHFGGQFAAGTRIVTWAWLAIYVLVPVLMLIILAVQARTPGTDPPRSAPLPAWIYAVLAAQAVVLLGFGVALFAVPGSAAPLWPWKLTPLVAQATGAWLISLGVAAAQALLERDARRLRPAAVGYILLAVLQCIALARYPHHFAWGSAAGIIYLTFLGTMLLAGVVGLARGLPRQAGSTAAQRRVGV